MEAVWKIEVKDFPAFILVDDKGNDFFANVCGACLPRRQGRQNLKPTIARSLEPLRSIDSYIRSSRERSLIQSRATEPEFEEA